MEVRSRKELKFYLAADMMMNRRVFSYTLRQRIKNILCPDYIMCYLNSMRKCSYYNYKFKNRHGVVGRIVGGGTSSSFLLLLQLLFKIRYQTWF